MLDKRDPTALGDALLRQRGEFADKTLGWVHDNIISRQIIPNFEESEVAYAGRGSNRYSASIPVGTLQNGRIVDS